MITRSRRLDFGPITPAEPAPLYVQLINNIKREIAAGRVTGGEALPSTRVLAADMRVSVITVARAYDELSQGGIVYSRQGQRTFVAQDAAEKLKTESSGWAKLIDRGVEDAPPDVSDETIAKHLQAALNRRGRK